MCREGQAGAKAHDAKEAEAGAEARSNPTLSVLGAHLPRGLQGLPSWFCSAPIPATPFNAWLLWHKAGLGDRDLAQTVMTDCKIPLSGGRAPAPPKAPGCSSHWESVPQPGTRGGYIPAGAERWEVPEAERHQPGDRQRGGSWVALCHSTRLALSGETGHR